MLGRQRPSAAGDKRTERADASMFNRLCELARDMALDGLARDVALDSQLFDVQPGFRAHALWLNCCIRETGIPEEGLFCLAKLSPNGRFHTVLNRIKFAFAAGLFLTPPPFAAEPKCSTHYRRAKLDFSILSRRSRLGCCETRPVPVEVVETPRAEAPARPEEVLSPRARSSC